MTIRERQRELGEDVERIIALEHDSMIQSDGWISLISIWRHLREMGEARDRDKREFLSTASWSKESSHVTGLQGEAAVSIITGLKLNCELITTGDGGADFVVDGKTVDVKTTLYWHDPHLKQEQGPKHWADFFVLAASNSAMGTVRICGWASKEQLQSAGKRDYGHGKRLSIEESGLNPGLPAWMPKRQLAEGITRERLTSAMDRV